MNDENPNTANSVTIEYPTVFTNSFSEEIWKSTYRFGEESPQEMWRRVAKDIASLEENPEVWEEEFYSVLENFTTMPGGRILSNAGTTYQGTTYMNCFTTPFPKYDADSLEGIMEMAHCFAQTLKSEGGIGANFSYIRPRGAHINGIGVDSPGSVSFMQIFDKISEIITQGSGKKNSKGKTKIRKGAMMAILGIWHPSVVEFIKAKQSKNMLAKFNVSVAVTNEFMDKLLAVKAGDEAQNTWDLKFPDTTHEKYKEEWDGEIAHWEAKGYPVEIYETVKVTDLWETIMQSTYSRNEPGVLFLDRAQEDNLLNYIPEKMARTTNPCAEQIMPDASTCNLISHNLTQYYDEKTKSFDFEKFKKNIPIVVRFCDNVNDVSRFPLTEYKLNAVNYRRMGIGTMGWGSLLYMLKIPFVSKEASELKSKILKMLVHESVKASALLAKEKGAFKDCNNNTILKNKFINRINLPQETRDIIQEYGVRNSSFFSNQPNGNTSIVANVVSGGIEAVFLPEYIRTSICPYIPTEIFYETPKWYNGEWYETKIFKFDQEGDEQILRGEYKGTVYKIDKNRGLTAEEVCMDYGRRFLGDDWDPTAPYAQTALSLSVSEHVNDLGEFTFWQDSSSSKTVNCPEDYPYEDFENLYLEAYQTGWIKGITTYRAGTMTSVLKAIDEKEKKDKREAGGIVKTTAPKRPRELPCDVFHPTFKGEKFYCVVGKLGDDPYEVFTGCDKDKNIPQSLKTGKVIKKAKGNYLLEDEAGRQYPLTSEFSDTNIYALTRMISTALRHGSSIEFVCEQLNKTEGTFMSFAKVIARTLKQYIKDGTKVTGEICDHCGSHNVVYKEGCQTCLDCGASKCG